MNQRAVLLVPATALATLLLACTGRPKRDVCAAVQTPQATSASTQAAPVKMDNVFPMGAHWKMPNRRKDKTVGTTTFDVLPIDRFGCESGELIDLRESKDTPEAYWGPGNPTVITEHFILRRDDDGSWRAIGDYTESADPKLVLTRNYRTPAAATVKPYVITPGTLSNARLETRYWYTFQFGTHFECMTGDEPGIEYVHWLTEFTWDGTTLHSHYAENTFPYLSEEFWVFQPRTGLTDISVVCGGGKPFTPPLALTRN